MKTDSDPLHVSYFDLLKDKYPDLNPPRAAGRVIGRPRSVRASPRPRIWVPLAVAVLAVGFWRVWTLRPEGADTTAKWCEPVRLAPTEATTRPEDSAPELARGDARPPAEEAAPPDRRELPLEVGGDVKPPRRLAAAIPRYPDEAWAEGVTGDVLVRAVIDARGEVAEVEVLKGLPYGMTEVAVEAIRRWRFAPATRHGKPVAVYRNLSVRFET